MSDQSPIQLTPAFKLIFITVVILTLVSLVAMFVILWLAGNTTSPPPHIQAGLDTFSTTYKLGFGAIIGLIGGKAT